MGQQQGGGRRRAHVLVVDDDADFLSFMEILLTSEGYTVDLASTPDEWEAKFRGTRPDVLICDLRLAGTPRFALIDRLIATPDAAAIPVILCSGAPQDFDAARVRLEGRPVAMLPKPFEIDQVFACLDQLLT